MLARRAAQPEYLMYCVREVAWSLAPPIDVLEVETEMEEIMNVLESASGIHAEDGLG